MRKPITGRIRVRFSEVGSRDREFFSSPAPWARRSWAGDVSSRFPKCGLGFFRGGVPPPPPRRIHGPKRWREKFFANVRFPMVRRRVTPTPQRVTPKLVFGLGHRCLRELPGYLCEPGCNRVMTRRRGGRWPNIATTVSVTRPGAPIRVPTPASTSRVNRPPIFFFFFFVGDHPRGSTMFEPEALASRSRRCPLVDQCHPEINRSIANAFLLRHSEEINQLGRATRRRDTKRFLANGRQRPHGYAVAWAMMFLIFVTTGQAMRFADYLNFTARRPAL